MRLSLITEDKIYGQHIVKVMYNKIYPTIYIEERKCKVEEEQYIYIIVYVMYSYQREYRQMYIILNHNLYNVYLTRSAYLE